MLVGCKTLYNKDGSSYVVCDIQGSPEELARLYNKEEVEVNVDKEEDYRLYEPSVEDDYNAFIEELSAEIDDLDVDDLFVDDEE